MAATDSLTGVHNRGAFERGYARHLDMFRRYGNPFAMLMVDVDDFKIINDKHGHRAGGPGAPKPDGPAGKLRAQGGRHLSVRGGDEFVIILPNTDKKHALRAKERIRQRLDYQKQPQPQGALQCEHRGWKPWTRKRDGDILDQLDTDLYRDRGQEILSATSKASPRTSKLS